MRQQPAKRSSYYKEMYSRESEYILLFKIGLRKIIPSTPYSPFLQTVASFSLSACDGRRSPEIKTKRRTQLQKRQTKLECVSQNISDIVLQISASFHTNQNTATRTCCCVSNLLPCHLGEPRCFHEGDENDMENDEDKQETEDDEGIESPYAVVVVSETFTTLVPYMYNMTA